MSAFEVIKESCPARVGLMGNPSDGFHGKTLRSHLLIDNVHITVI
jgi:hypothetical protein